jgi:hypothetical protein
MALLCLVLEEDSGEDVTRLYGDRATPERLAGFHGEPAIPAPAGLADLLAHPASEPPHAEPIHLLRDGRPLEDQVARDDWIAASIIRLDVPEGSSVSHWRLQARSADSRNDWTLWLQARLEY